MCGLRKVGTGIAGRISDWRSCPNQLFIRSVVSKVSVASDIVRPELLTNSSLLSGIALKTIALS